jgi:hypothetical protein
MVVTFAAFGYALISESWLSAAAFFLGCVALLFGCRHDLKAREMISPQTLLPWLDALQARDPFDPDAQHDYRLTGFVTSFVVAVSAPSHPLLGVQRLIVFRDEIAADQWRTLVTHIRHGAYRHPLRRDSSKSFEQTLR